MVESYPSEVETFTVIGRLVKGLVDSDDAGVLPDVVPIVGARITFTPSFSPPVFRVPTADPPVTVYQETVIATTDEEGYLKVPEDPTRGVVLAYGFSEGINPSGWTWTVSISVGGNFPDSSMTIVGAPGGVVDLAKVVSVPPDPGSELAQWVVAVDAVQADRIRAESAASAAAQSEVQAKAARDEAVVEVNSSPADWSGAITIDKETGKGAYIIRRLTGNVVVTMAPGDPGVAHSCTLELKQDLTGGRTLVLPNVSTPFGVAIPLSTGANLTDIVRLEWNGTYWRAFLAGQAMATPTAWIV